MPGWLGTFDVTVDGKLVFSKAKAGRFPGPGEVIRMVKRLQGGLYATIRPDSSRDGYHFDLSANIPLEMEGDKSGAYDMVFSPSRGG